LVPLRKRAFDFPVVWNRDYCYLLIKFVCFKGKQSLKLRFGKTWKDFAPPHSIEWEILSQNIDNRKDKNETLDKALGQLIQRVKEKKLEKTSRILLVVPDHTRRCNLPTILPRIIHSLELEINAQIEILIANGSHVIEPFENVKTLLGEYVTAHYIFSQHDCRDKESLEYIGDTSNGTPIWINKKVLQADLVISIGGILYHYFAGFGGGPKMLLPGVAGHETIRINHRRTIDKRTGKFHSHCYEGNISTNPVYLDLVEIVDYIHNWISFQMALDTNGDIFYAAAGEVQSTQKEVCEYVEKIFSIPIQYKADIVIASAGGFPADVNLIQTHKAIHHAFQAVKENGVIIIFAACEDGIGSATFMPYLQAGNSEEIGKMLLDDYKINGHTALAVKTKAEQAKILLISQLDPSLVKKTGMYPCADIQSAWERLDTFDVKMKNGYILPTANVHVPRMLD
jgi:nickel-dependent lactate racemase